MSLHSIELAVGAGIQDQQMCFPCSWDALLSIRIVSVDFSPAYVSLRCGGMQKECIEEVSALLHYLFDVLFSVKAIGLHAGQRIFLSIAGRWAHAGTHSYCTLDKIDDRS